MHFFVFTKVFVFFGTNGDFYPCFLLEKSPIKYLTKGVSFAIIKMGKGFDGFSPYFFLYFPLPTNTI